MEERREKTHDLEAIDGVRHMADMQAQGENGDFRGTAKKPKSVEETQGAKESKLRKEVTRRKREKTGQLAAAQGVIILG